MQTSLTNLLALLRAARESHHTGHWTVKGASFVGDHELLGELYTTLDSAIDSLGEELVFDDGEMPVDLPDQLELISDFAVKWQKEKDLIKRAAMVEEQIQDAITTLVKDHAESLDVAVDNFLRGIADSRRFARYKLRRRLAS